MKRLGTSVNTEIPIVEKVVIGNACSTITHAFFFLCIANGITNPTAIMIRNKSLIATVKNAPKAKTTM